MGVQYKKLLVTDCYGDWAKDRGPPRAELKVNDGGVPMKLRGNVSLFLSLSERGKVKRRTVTASWVVGGDTSFFSVPNCALNNSPAKVMYSVQEEVNPSKATPPSDLPWPERHTHSIRESDLQGIGGFPAVEVLPVEKVSSIMETFAHIRSDSLPARRQAPPGLSVKSCQIRLPNNLCHTRRLFSKRRTIGVAGYLIIVDWFNNGVDGYRNFLQQQIVEDCRFKEGSLGPLRLHLTHLNFGTAEKSYKQRKLRGRRRTETNENQNSGDALKDALEISEGPVTKCATSRQEIENNSVTKLKRKEKFLEAKYALACVVLQPPQVNIMFQNIYYINVPEVDQMDAAQFTQECFQPTSNFISQSDRVDVSILINTPANDTRSDPIHDPPVTNHEPT
ncbi:hypothetical protein WN55_00451 [Dufourea novaeangliae]|uniref:Uncharacterized protein n=1 Tax=Dufourea novaeangliae TaxID=178035 RepID=A0A154PD32_DUFNO|nr:hypothetical protein WN55_00451 [Dufourea novaeangliae]